MDPDLRGGAVDTPVDIGPDSIGAQFLGSRYPIMCGAMSWISERNLVSAISNAGGFGVVACGAMSVNNLREEIDATFAMTDRTFGVNVITLHPDCESLVDACLQRKVSHIILGGGLPKVDFIKKIRDGGVKVMCFAPTLALALRLVKVGVDAIIIEGSEAGGHIGPVSTSVLVQEILPHINVPVFVAGGIGNGSIINAYMRLGASGCQLGTRFVCSRESIAHQNFKNTFIRSSSRDAAISVQLYDDLPVIPVRAINNKASEEFRAVQHRAAEQYRSGAISRDEARLEIEKFWVGALRKAVIDGDVESGSVMAGQSVGMITKEQTAQEIIDELISQVRLADLAPILSRQGKSAPVSA